MNNTTNPSHNPEFEEIPKKEIPKENNINLAVSALLENSTIDIIDQLYIQCVENFDNLDTFSVEDIVNRFITKSKRNKILYKNENQYLESKSEYLRNILINKALDKAKISKEILTEMGIVWKIINVEKLDFWNTFKVITMKWDKAKSHWIIVIEYTKINPETNKRTEMVFYRTP